jgi:2-polyprenyl-3-methyl-5-hydroxy-6-metoxy-1,4-benzoquinol methylase
MTTYRPCMRHADADLRQRELRADPYTVHRIKDRSYSRIAEILAHCSGVDHEAALDVGCGAGFDTFALAAEFDRIIAIEVERRPLRTARRIAREHQLVRVAFRRQDARIPASGGPFDFIYCNAMSHYTPQRGRLVETLVQSAKPEGWLFISEETEGYAPLEIEKAIRERDNRRLRARLRQVMNGVLGVPAFRFFVSGTLEPLLFACGAEVTRTDTTDWVGLPYLQRTWARRVNETMAVEAIDDYTDLPEELVQLRDVWKPLVGRQLTRDERFQLLEFAKSESRLAPFAIFVLIIEVVDAGLSWETSLIEKIRSRGPARLRGAQPDWERVDDLFTQFRDLVAAQHDAEMPSKN